ncbi:hypothetical protein EDB81DRAFT_3424 [Dactylonectria macrodidyma]|uniref:Uncharacterized protein n=1 Tax=Dactylonectria macrodidyma TaxID=307937 RepID=A0A9P9JIC6_9HYPO|nr:hypothetical protein EDB81DRAFT_3424 [Dactylonectria macrodidyma]
MQAARPRTVNCQAPILRLLFELLALLAWTTLSCFPLSFFFSLGPIFSRGLRSTVRFNQPIRLQLVATGRLHCDIGPGLL